jgi:hypothetical protein
MKFHQSRLARLAILPGLTFVACVVLSGAASGALQEKQLVLGRGSECLALNADGALLRWEGRMAEKTNVRSSSAGEIRYGGNILKLARPATVAREQNGFSFTYRWTKEPEIEVII